MPEFKKLIGTKALSIDTTDEFDNLGTLHPATGPIKEAQELAAKADELRIRIDELYGKWEEAENRLSALVSDL